VYRAKYQGAIVAVKFLKDNILDEESICKEVSTECGVMRKLHHPNLSRLFAYSLDKQHRCLIMELAERGSLYNVLQDKKTYPIIAWKRRLDIGIDIAKGLLCLHSRPKPIVHRDLKSLNVLIRHFWGAFICDFGFARIKETNDQNINSKGGSPPWMAPELSEEDSIITPAIDIFSFGMVMYELLTRETPFGIEKLSRNRITIAISNGKRPLVPNDTNMYPSTQNIPKGYMDLMYECWDQDAENRPIISNLLFRLQQISKGLLESNSEEMKEEKKEVIKKAVDEAQTDLQLPEGVDPNNSLVSPTPVEREEKKKLQAQTDSIPLPQGIDPNNSLVTPTPAEQREKKEFTGWR